MSTPQTPQNSSGGVSYMRIETGRGYNSPVLYLRVSPSADSETRRMVESACCIARTNFKSLGGRTVRSTVSSSISLDPSWRPCLATCGERPNARDVGRRHCKLGLARFVVLMADSAETAVWEVPAERAVCNCLQPRRRSSPSCGCGGCAKGKRLTQCSGMR